MTKGGCSAWTSPGIFGVVARARVVAEAVEVVMVMAGAGSPGRVSRFHKLQVPRWPRPTLVVPR